MLIFTKRGMFFRFLWVCVLCVACRKPVIGTKQRRNEGFHEKNQKIDGNIVHPGTCCPLRYSGGNHGNGSHENKAQQVEAYPFHREKLFPEIKGGQQKCCRKHQMEIFQKEDCLCQRQRKSHGKKSGKSRDYGDIPLQKI
jgi:hypothetical protein